jgi:hypothetical protein
MYRVEIACLMIFDTYMYPSWDLWKINHDIKTLAVCGGIHGVDDTSRFFFEKM